MDDTELGKAGIAPLCRSVFLKARSANGPGRQRYQASGSAGQTASKHVAKSAPASAAHTRSNLALRKVAQLESKIMNRKKQLELQKGDLGQKALDEESFSSASDHEQSARGKRFLKNSVTAGGNRTLSNACPEEEASIQSPQKKVTVKQQLGLDSDEEEMRELMERSLEFSSGKEEQGVVTTDSQRGGKSKTPVSSGMPLPSHQAISPTGVSEASSFHSKDSEKNGCGGITSPAGRNLSAQHGMSSPSLSSSMKDKIVELTQPRTGNAKQSQISLESDGSEVKSLDELFSEAADAGDSTPSSSSDFRPNILSLDDLAPAVTSEAAELKQGGTDVGIIQESNRNAKPAPFLAEEDQTSLKMPSAAFALSGGNDVEKNETEAEISEHLSDVSAAFSSHPEDHLDCHERTVNSEYSEDFETSLSTANREWVAQMSEERSKSCTSSGKHPPSASSPALSRGRRDHRVTVKETAVQTVDPPFTYCWSKTNGSAVLHPPAGNSYVDPVPIASHVISADAIEALTAYSPAALALNAMVKQHLMLTQQFVETIHHLHCSLVESLEQEKFHYHTLEEAKEYVKNHKSPPLTIEQARKEIQKAEEKKWF